MTCVPDVHVKTIRTNGCYIRGRGGTSGGTYDWPGRAVSTLARNDAGGSEGWVGTVPVTGRRKPSGMWGESLLLLLLPSNENRFMRAAVPTPISSIKS